MPFRQTIPLSHTLNLEIPLIFGHAMVQNLVTRGVKSQVFFSRDKNSLRTSVEINSGIYAEGNLSANAIRDRIKFLLSAFGIESREFLLYLREDRNAGE